MRVYLMRCKRVGRHMHQFPPEYLRLTGNTQTLGKYPRRTVQYY